MLPLHPYVRFIKPCRSLCESVRDSCAPIMSCYGYPWPDILRCDQYPADHYMCISSITNSTFHTVGRRGERFMTQWHFSYLHWTNVSISGLTFSVPQASCQDCQLEEASSSKDTLETFCRSDFGGYQYRWIWNLCFISSIINRQDWYYKSDCRLPLQLWNCVWLVSNTARLASRSSHWLSN